MPITSRNETSRLLKNALKSSPFTNKNPGMCTGILVLQRFTDITTIYITSPPEAIYHNVIM